MKKIFKIISQYSFIPLVKYYLRSDRNYTYKGIRIKVKTGVFHPGLFFSTKLLIRFLQQNIPLQGKKLLELGAGTGLIALSTAREGAVVTASDINPKAIENLKINAELNQQHLTIIESDLFDKFPQQVFDIIVIQPPFYPHQPKSMEEHAWFCGEDFEYFRKLFQQLGNFTGAQSTVIMILSDDCRIDLISRIANENGFEMTKVFEKKKYWEWNYIFQISR